MHGVDKLIAGILLGAAAMTGLFIAAHAQDVGFSSFGYLLFLFAVLMLFRFIALITGKGELLP